jgi:[acyl-carrier-protein] S-malonyltransferase
VLAIVCPGQGSQKPGFLQPWLELPGARQAVSAMSESAGVDLVVHGTESDADTIRDTAVAQPLLVAAAFLAADALHERLDGPSADLLAGHSVGEIAAAGLAGVLSREDALRLVSVRSRAMATAAAAAPTGMAAVVGGVRAEVLAAIEAAGLEPANINSAGQVVAAGATDALKVLAENAPARTRVIPLQVAGAFHTRYMAPARDELAAFAPELSTSQASTPLVSNAGGEVITDGHRYLDLIVRQVASPVDWEACMNTFRDRGVTALLELNPAGTLTGLAKRDLKGVERANLNTPDDLDAALALVRDHATGPADATSAPKEN